MPWLRCDPRMPPRDLGGRQAWKRLADPQDNIAKIDAIERVTKHDITAFTTWLGEFIGPQSRFVHQGLTSSDILDTTFAVQLTQAADILLADIDKLLAALKKRALEHKNTLTIGRSHAVHAEPTTFGTKLAGHYAAFARNRARLVAARAEIATCAIPGPVGNSLGASAEAPRSRSACVTAAPAGRPAGWSSGFACAHPSRCRGASPARPRRSGRSNRSGRTARRPC